MRYTIAGLAVAALLTGCAVTGKPVAAPVTDEWRGAVVNAVSRLGTTLGPVADALIATDYPAMHKACEDLRTYLNSMERTVLPGPDVNVNTALEDGIDGYRSMADQCVKLSPTSGLAEMTRMDRDMRGADKRIKDGLALLGITIPPR
ncbi:hypothetical protein ACWDTP_23230 [Mycobacterium sp. NPDC003449]